MTDMEDYEALADAFANNEYVPDEGPMVSNAIRALVKRVREAKAENERLRKALRFYAHNDIVIGHMSDGKIIAHDDFGRIATAALAPTEEAGG